MLRAISKSGVSAAPMFGPLRLGRKKASDPRDLDYLARDNPATALVADPRDTGVVVPGVKEKLRRAGISLTQRATSAGVAEWAADLPKLSRSHKRSSWFPLWQDGFSACVGFTFVELVMAGPIMQHLYHVAKAFDIKGPDGYYSNLAKETIEAIAREWYLRAQDLDEWDGKEPSYYGTSGRAGAKVGQQLGLWPNYLWLTSVPELARYLILHGPVPIGVDVFTSDLEPTEMVRGRKEPTALLQAAGAWEGGHEMLVDYVNIKTQRFGGPQSWGVTPGQSPYERWEMSFADMEYRFSQGGDALAIPEVRLAA